MSDIEADKAAIIVAYKAILDTINEDDYDMCMTYYTETAMHVPPGGDVIRGKDNIKAHFAKSMPPIQDLVPGDVIYFEMINETTVYRLNYLHSVDKDGNKRGTYKDGLLWKKVGEKWLLDRDMYNDCGGPM